MNKDENEFEIITNKDLELSKSISPFVKSFFENTMDSFGCDEEDMIMVYNNTDFKDPTIRERIIESNQNFCILFSVETIISEILHSYRDGDLKENISHQIKLDFPRMDICFNSQKCQTINQFQLLIEKFKKYNHPVMDNLYDLLLLFTTQSSFFYSFKMMHDIYSLPNINTYVFADEDMPNIDIIDNRISIDVVFKKTFKHMDITNSETKIINKFQTFMVITINLMTVSSGYLYPEFNYSNSETAIFYWFDINN